MVLGVLRLLTLGDIVWNFSSLTMQFVAKGRPCIIYDIVPGLLATTSSESNPKCFVAVGKLLGPYATVLSFSDQMMLAVRGLLS